MRSILFVMALTILTTSAAHAQRMKTPVKFNETLGDAIHMADLMKVDKSTAEAGKELNVIAGELAYIGIKKDLPPAVREALIAKEIWKAEDGMGVMFFQKRKDHVERLYSLMEGVLTDMKIKDFGKYPPAAIQELRVGALHDFVMNRARELDAKEYGRHDSNPSPVSVLKAQQQAVEIYSEALAAKVAPSLIETYHGKDAELSFTKETTRRLGKILGKSSEYYKTATARNFGGINAAVADAPLNFSSGGSSQH